VFGNPVAQAVIRPPGSPTVVGDFRVTQPFGPTSVTAEPPGHGYPHFHGGVDIGNGKCGDPLLAMSDGKITLAGKVSGSAALIIRGIDPAFPDLEWAVAHCATITVKVGQFVHQGDRIGTLGTTGATACHVHVGLKLKGVSIDVWPYLDQNQENEVIDAPVLARITNRQCSTNAASGVKFRADPSTSKPELMIFPAGTVFQPDFAVQGAAVAGTTQWFSGMLVVKGKPTRGYFHESTVGPLLPVEAADCADAVTKATAPLLVKIDAARKDLA
jgi:murein DD-endopeptidase MepM/ murein hydrolase activator NlpD